MKETNYRQLSYEELNSELFNEKDAISFHEKEFYAAKSKVVELQFLIKEWETKYGETVKTNAINENTDN